MRQLYLTFTLFIICIFIANGENNKLFYPKQVLNETNKSNEILQKSNAYNSVDFIEIDLNGIFNHQQFTIQIKNEDIIIDKEQIDIRGVNNYTFIGSNKAGISILLSVLGDDILGTVEADGEVYSIETVGKKEYALIKYDYSLLLEACENIPEEYVLPDTSEVNELDNKNIDISSSPKLSQNNESDCKIRVLVLYTPSASSKVNSIKHTIDYAVSLTNESFIYSGVNFEIELAYAGLTNYSEYIYTTDLERFRINGDGYMDEVHTLRDEYSADVCVLIADLEGGICGRASIIGATDDKAFCIVSINNNCATNYYSFGHEIGHLLGCRHNIEIDSNTAPFAYGHGYTNPSKTWRTIMTYPSACNSCPRLRYWSNPYVTYYGENMGTTSTHYNARVWNERSNAIMSFRQPKNNVYFTNSDIENAKTANVTAHNNISTSNVVNVPEGTSLNMKAGNAVILQPGFSVEYGADFSATIDNISDCGSN